MKVLCYQNGRIVEEHACDAVAIVGERFTLIRKHEGGGELIATKWAAPAPPVDETS